MMNADSERFKARTNKPQFPGDGQSRTLATQSGETVRLLQSAMFQEGGVYTIVFDVSYPPELVFACVALIKWSENGNTVRRMIDVVKGTQISTPGRLLDISLTDTTPETLPLSGGTATPGEGTPYTVTALVERGNRAQRGQPPTLDGGSFQLLAHASETVAIPTQVGVISLRVLASQAVAFPAAAPNLLIVFTTASGGIFKQYSSGADSGFVPIPPGATEVTVTNADGAITANVGLVFGIDG